VDNFAVATPSPSIATQIFDLIDDYLTIPLKRLGLITLFNGIDVVQTQHFIKISCKSYLECTPCAKYLDIWMRKHHIMPMHPTPLPQTDSFLKSFLAAEGSSDPTMQDQLSNDMGINTGTESVNSSTH
jgi:hypothetical protein